jgi:hypothetical protein
MDWRGQNIDLLVTGQETFQSRWRLSASDSELPLARIYRTAEFYIARPIVRRSRQRFLFAAAPGNRSRKFQEEGVFTQPPDEAWVIGLA